MEKMGVPSVAVATEAYVDIAHLTAAQRGMPTLRIAFTPHPVWGKTDAQIHDIVFGPAPVTGKPLMKEIVADLTRPLPPEDERSGIFPVSAGPATIPTRSSARAAAVSRIRINTRSSKSL